MRSVTVVKVFGIFGIAAAIIGPPSAARADAPSPPSWSSIHVQTPSGSPNRLSFGNMVCPTKKLCWSAGNQSSATTGALMERMHKGKFTLVHTPIANALLEGISCPKAHACWVVGSKPVGQTHIEPVIEHWTGKKWKGVHTPNPQGNDNFLNDVSCPSKKRCYAVGGYGSSSSVPMTLKPLVERWNGKKWSQHKGPPTPAHSSSAYPNAISCVAAARCVAVGVFTATGSYDFHTFSDVLRGKKWSLRTVPQPFHGEFAYANNSDVACMSAKHCVMSGYAAPDAQGRTDFDAEAWKFTGKTWKLLRLPKGIQHSGGGLLDVTCDSAKQCWLVGYAYVSGSTSQRAVALRDKGAVVASATVAQPGSGYDELDAVGCVRHGPCLAVGDSDTLSGIASAFGDRTS